MLGCGKVVAVDNDKDRQSAEENWASLALSKGFRCSACGAPTAYVERELYFLTGRCGQCTNVVGKDN